MISFIFFNTGNSAPNPVWLSLQPLVERVNTTSHTELSTSPRKMSQTVCIRGILNHVPWFHVTLKSQLTIVLYPVLNLYDFSLSIFLENLSLSLIENAEIFLLSFFLCCLGLGGWYYQILTSQQPEILHFYTF